MPMFPEGQDPLDQSQGPAQRAPIGAPSPDPFTPPPTIGEAIPAAFRQNNPIFSVLDAITQQSPSHAYDPNYNPLTVLKGTRFEQDPTPFLDDPNEATTRARMAKSDSEQNDQRTLAASGWAGTIASLGAGLADPSYYLPIFGELHAAEAGGSLLRSAVRTAATGALQSGVSEAALQASQQSRTWKESAGNIATNTLLMGALGGALGTLSRGERAAANDGLEAARREATPINPLDPASMSMQDHVTPGESGLSQGVEQRAQELHAAGAAPDIASAAEAAHIESLPSEVAHEIYGPTAQSSIREAADHGGIGGLPDPSDTFGESGGGRGSAGGDGVGTGDAGIGPAERPAAVDGGTGNAVAPPTRAPDTLPMAAQPDARIPTPGADAVVDRLRVGDFEGDPAKPGADASMIQRVLADAEGQGRNRLIDMLANDAGVGGSDGGSVMGAAAGADVSDPRDLVMKGYGLNQVAGLRKIANALSPNLRVFSGASTAAKRAMADLAETAIRFTQHDRGIPTASAGGPLETMVHQDQAKLTAAAHDVLHPAWMDHRYGDTVPGKGRLAADTIADARGQTPDGKLSYKDFKSSVYDAMYSGDQHPVPQVQQAARDLRAKVFDPVAKMAQETLGPDGRPMLGEALSPPGGDLSFVPRSWNKEAVTAKRFDLRQRITDWLMSEQADHAAAADRLTGYHRDLTEAEASGDAERAAGARARIEKEIEDYRGRTGDEARAALKDRAGAEAERAEKLGSNGGPPLEDGDIARLTSADAAVDRAVKRITEADHDISRMEMEDRANEIIDRIIGSPDGRIGYDMASGGPRIGFTGDGSPPRGSLQSRDFAIPTELVKDYVNRDIEHVTSSFLRTMLPDIQLTRRFGDVDMTNTFRKIQEEYARKITAETSEAEAKAINAARNSDIRDVAAVRDRLRGVYGWTPGSRVIPDIVRDFRNATSLASLGTSVANRFNDTGAQAVFRYGLQNVFNDAWRPFFKSMLGMSELAGIAKQQAAEMGIGIDGLMGHLRHNLSDINESYAPGNKFSRGLAYLNDRSMFVNMHGPWTNWMKAMTWVPAQAEFGRIADRIAAGGATKRDLQVMADANIDPHMAVRISQQIGQHSITVDGVRMATAGKWTDLGARDAFERAMAREANINVITAGIGDKPLLLSTPLGGMLGQFKGFVAGAHERIFISNLQQRDGRTLQGMLVSVAMGMISYRLYTLLAGQEASPRPQDWVKEGIHRSAITGWLSEANNTLAKFTGGKTDLNNLYGADRPLTRRQGNSPLSELLGPTYARLEGLTGAATHIISGKATSADVHQARMALPLQNLMGVRRLIDEAEDGVAANLGMKPRNRSPQEWPQ